MRTPLLTGHHPAVTFLSRIIPYEYNTTCLG